MLGKEPPQKFLRVFLRQRLGRRGRRRFIARLPKGKRPDDFRSAAARLLRSNLRGESRRLRERAGCKNVSPGAKGRRVSAQASARCLIGQSLPSGFMSRERSPAANRIQAGRLAVGRASSAGESEADETKRSVRRPGGLIGETRSPSPSARKRCVRKFIAKTSPIASATLAMIPRREKPIAKRRRHERDDETGPGQRQTVLQMGAKGREQRCGKIGVETQIVAQLRRR